MHSLTVTMRRTAVKNVAAAAVPMDIVTVP